MVKVESTGTVEGLRSGIPDYRQWVWSSNVIHRIKLTSEEAVMRFIGLWTEDPDRYPLLSSAPLASLTTAYLVNAATGLSTFTYPAGYTLATLTYWCSFSRPTRWGFLYDGSYSWEWHEDGGRGWYEHDLLEDYNPYDPTGLTSHTVRWPVTNLAAEAMVGFCNITAKLLSVGTPPIEKTVKCPTCGNEHKVERTEHVIECPKCQTVTTYMPFLFGDEIDKLRRRA